MQYRKLGNTGLEISAFSFGGIVSMNQTTKDAADAVALAIDSGVNYFDVAPSYGNAQDMLGPALKPYRSKVHLACKTGKRDKAGARAELENSLRVLQTDYFDVYQLHGIDDFAEIDQALAPGGALEAIVDAKKEGLVRNIGFSCHKEQSAVKLINAYDFATMLFPFNFTYWLGAGVGEDLIGLARSRGMGIIAMKALAHRKWADAEERTYPKAWYKPIFDDDHLADLALRFVLSKPVSTALSPGDIRLLKLGLSIAADRSDPGAITLEEMETLTRIARDNAKDFMWDK